MIRPQKMHYINQQRSSSSFNVQQDEELEENDY